MASENKAFEIIENRVLIIFPADVEDRSWEQLCDCASGGVMVLIRSTFEGSKNPEQSLVESGTKLCRSTLGLRRGRVSVGALLDLCSACRFSARAMRERAAERVAEAVEISRQWQELGGTTPRHPSFALMMRAGRDALDCCRLARRYSYAADVLKRMANCAFPEN